MLRMKSHVAAVAIVAVLIGGFCARAADPTVSASEVVEYRLAKWRTTHSEGAKAEKLVATLKKLRCEVKVGSHGGHTDVKYRCAKWQSLALKDHKTAHQWESWLKKYGFETKHKH
jgi:hypothetical protein